MKAIALGLIVLAIQVATAVPHRHNHAHFHDKRVVVTAVHTVIDIITVTAPDAVVWVDENGNLIGTEFHNSTAPPTALPTSINTPNSPLIDSILTSTSSALTSSTAVAAAPAGLTSVSSAAVVSATSMATPTSVSTALSTSTKVVVPIVSVSPLAAAPSSVVNLVSTGTGAGTAVAAAATVDTSASNARIIHTGSSITNGFGICYDVLDNTGACKSTDQMNSDFTFLAGQGYIMVRIYGVGCSVGSVISTAATHNLKMFVGLNGITNLQSDLTTLIDAVSGNWGNVDTVNIGNELINTGAATVPQVVSAVNSARGTLRAAGFSGSVVTVDTFNQVIANPQLCAASDYCAANAHAYFDPNAVASQAGAFVQSSYQGIVNQAANGKRVVISESGWPYQGDANGNAVPSVANQQAAIQSIVTAFSSHPQDLFLFQAYDAGYKSPGSLGVEQYFGIYDADHYSGTL